MNYDVVMKKPAVYQHFPPQQQLIQAHHSSFQPTYQLSKLYPQRDFFEKRAQ